MKEYKFLLSKNTNIWNISKKQLNKKVVIKIKEHVDRKNHFQHNKNIDLNIKNIELNEIVDIEDYDEYLNNLINVKTQKNKNNKDMKLQDNTILKIDMIHTLTNEQHQQLIKNDFDNSYKNIIKSYFLDYLEKLKKFLKRPLIRAVLHLDEKNPHVHFEFSNWNFEKEKTFTTLNNDSKFIINIKNFEKQFLEKAQKLNQNLLDWKIIDFNKKHYKKIDDFKNNNEIEKTQLELKKELEEKSIAFFNILEKNENYKNEIENLKNEIKKYENDYLIEKQNFENNKILIDNLENKKDWYLKVFNDYQNSILNYKKKIDNLINLEDNNINKINKLIFDLEFFKNRIIENHRDLETLKYLNKKEEINNKEIKKDNSFKM